MAEAIASKPHFLLVVPNLTLGFMTVFLVVPIFKTILYDSQSSFPALPRDVFFNYWQLLIGNSTYLSAAVVFSFIVGLVFGDTLYFIFYYFTSLVGLRRAWDALKNRLSNLEKVEDKEKGKNANTEKWSEDADFHIWLNSYESGAPGEYFDWSLFRTYTYNLLAVGFFYVWGAWTVWLPATSYLNPSQGISYWAEGVVIWVIFSLVSLASAWGASQAQVSNLARIDSLHKIFDRVRRKQQNDEEGSEGAKDQTPKTSSG